MGQLSQTAKQHLLYLGTIVLFGITTSANAEQKQIFGDYEVHYIVIPTMFLKADIAQRYNIVRAKNRALVNVSVSRAQLAVESAVTGQSKNLLSQVQTLKFNQVTEGPAVYYLAQLRHGDEEHHRLELNIEFPDGTTGKLNFQQKLYFEH